LLEITNWGAKSAQSPIYDIINEILDERNDIKLSRKFYTSKHSVEYWDIDFTILEKFLASCNELLEYSTEILTKLKNEKKRKFLKYKKATIQYNGREENFVCGTNISISNNNTDGPNFKVIDCLIDFFVDIGNISIPHLNDNASVGLKPLCLSFIAGRRYLQHIFPPNRQSKDLSCILSKFNVQHTTYKLSNKLEVWLITQIIGKSAFIHNTQLQHTMLNFQNNGRLVLPTWTTNSKENEWIKNDFAYSLPKIFQSNLL